MSAALASFFFLDLFDRHPQTPLRQHTLLTLTTHSSQNTGCHPNHQNQNPHHARLESALQHQVVFVTSLPGYQERDVPRSVVFQGFGYFHGCSISLIKPTEARRQRRHCLPGCTHANWAGEFGDGHLDDNRWAVYNPAPISTPETPSSIQLDNS